MKRIFTLLILSLLTSSIFAQIELGIESFDITINENEKHTFQVSINNVSETVNYDLYWQLIKGDDWPSEWETTVCDANLCYAANADSCSPNKPNDIPAGKSLIFTVKVDPMNVKGSGTLYMELFDDNQFTSKVAETSNDGLVVADAVLNVDFSQELDLVVFPNPTDSYFSIKNDGAVSQIGIYNIVGKEITRANHMEGQTHDVNNLSKGMYLVRMMDNQGKVLKSTRLNKR